MSPLRKVDSAELQCFFEHAILRSSELNDIDAIKQTYQIHKPEIESVAIEQYNN